MANPASTLSATRTSLFGPVGWCGLVLLPAILWIAGAKGNLFPLYQVQSQDLPILLTLPLLMLLADRWAPAWHLPKNPPSGALIAVAAAVLVLMLGWGCYALMGNFPLSRDEHMVVFDMAVYAKGQLATPVAPEWRDYARALVPAFLMNEQQPTGFVSSYLPVNAMLRLAFSTLADPVFYNPLLAACGAIALFDIARRTFRDDPAAQWVAMIVYVLSAQMLVNAMTTYAMTGHMALNLIWLAAFLRGGRAGHAVAIGIGLLATGLHQILFHPLFVAPFLLWRLRQGAWRLVLGYGIAYAVICGWWIVFPKLAVLQTGAPTSGLDSSAFRDRVLPLLLERDPQTVQLMVLNLMRFIAWQHLALLPLVITAVPLAWRDRGLAGPMLWGIGGAVVLVTIILPYQGHGWGYRYLSPFLGSFALLAGFGYQRLAARVGAKVDGMILLLSAITFLFSVPLLFERAYAFTAPHVALEQLIAARTTDFVVLDTQEPKWTSDGRWSMNAIDHVRNSPDLTNRPLRFSSRELTSQLVRDLCARGKIGLVTQADMHRVGFGLNRPPSSPRFEQMTRMFATGDCLVR